MILQQWNQLTGRWAPMMIFYWWGVQGMVYYGLTIFQIWTQTHIYHQPFDFTALCCLSSSPDHHPSLPGTTRNHHCDLMNPAHPRSHALTLPTYLTRICRHSQELPILRCISSPKGTHLVVPSVLSQGSALPSAVWGGSASWPRCWRG